MDKLKWLCIISLTTAGPLGSSQRHQLCNTKHQRGQLEQLGKTDPHEERWEKNLLIYIEKSQENIYINIK